MSSPSWKRAFDNFFFQLVQNANRKPRASSLNLVSTTNDDICDESSLWKWIFGSLTSSAVKSCKRFMNGVKIKKIRWFLSSFTLLSINNEEFFFALLLNWYPTWPNFLAAIVAEVLFVCVENLQLWMLICSLNKTTNFTSNLIFCFSVLSVRKTVNKSFSLLNPVQLFGRIMLWSVLRRAFEGKHLLNVTVVEGS